MFQSTAINDSERYQELTPPVPLDDAFAFILRLNSKVVSSGLTNADHCITFSSFKELCTTLSGAGARVLSKPVIILSDEAASEPDYILKAVALHWRYGGKYVLSRLKCSYLSKTGKLHISRVEKLELNRIALLPSVLTMPVREALLPQSHLLLFAPSDGFTVCVPEMPLPEKEMDRLDSVYRHEQRTPAESERLAKMGSLNHEILRRLPVSTHWPLAHQISARLSDHRELVSGLSLEVRDLSKSTAEATISLAERSADDLLYVAEELGDFLVRLSKRADVLLELRVSTLKTYITLSRQSSRGDEIALNISSISNEICRRATDLVFPLFEFLAGSLSSEALNAAYCSAAVNFENAEERCVRLAQSMRRFGHEASLGLLLANVYRARPEWLRKPSLLRSFQPLLGSSRLPALTSLVGEETVSKIQTASDVIDRFRSAIIAGDRSSAKQILHCDELAEVDFVRWMESLRGLPSELREMALSVEDLNIPGTRSQTGRKLAAIIFSDVALLKGMRDAGELDSRDELTAVALSTIGDDRMLNEMVCEKYAGADFIPFQIAGLNANQVFRNAARSACTSDRLDGPLISVIMTVHNPDIDLMRISLDSIEAQSWQNLEIIVVDDASERGTETAVQQLVSGYDRVRLIRLNVNSGPYHGRNVALQVAKGEFIAIQDGDDWSHPQRLAAQAEHLLHTPQARVVTTQHIRINQAGRVSLEGKFQFRAFGGGPMTSVFRSEVFRQIGGFAAVRSRGDFEMRERIVSYHGHQAHATIPLPMALCFADSGTLSNRTARRHAEHLHLFQANISRRAEMTSLFRDGIRLSTRHQVLAPMMLRSPEGAFSR